MAARSAVDKNFHHKEVAPAAEAFDNMMHFQARRYVVLANVASWSKFVSNAELLEACLPRQHTHSLLLNFY